MVSRQTTGILLVAGILLGLAPRFWMLFHMGVIDMEACYYCGKGALEQGVPQYYIGVYFPFQYQIFEVCAWAVTSFGIPFFTIYKIPNLVCDCGSFCLLLLLLKRQGSNPLYALVYWLHPWFLSMFSLGYIDFQFTFFVLFCVWCLRGERTIDYLLAGLPLSVAFLMKPQAQILVVAIFLYGLFRCVRKRDPRPWALLVAPSLLFLGYEIWFTFSLPPPRAMAAWVLPLSYLQVVDVMPALTAQMTNIWSPVAYFLREADQPLLSVSDQIEIVPHLQARYLAAVAVLGLIGWHVFRVERGPQISPSDQFARIFGFATLAIPFLMTCGHENHLFLGTVFLILLLAQTVSLLVKIAGHLLLLTQFVNVYSLYGEQPPALAQWFRRLQSAETAVILSIIAVVCFALVARQLWSRAPAETPK